MTTAMMLLLYAAFRLLDAVVLLTWRTARSEWHRFYNRHNPYRTWGGNVQIQAGRRVEGASDAKDGAIIFIDGYGNVLVSLGDSSRMPNDTHWKPKTWWGLV